LKTASGLLAGSIDIIKHFQPDMIVFAGDREDVLIGAMLGGFLGIPTIHFFGGDHASDGHIDNSLRHAASKIASAHIVSLDEHRQRLLSLGESPNRIFVVGSVALDKFVTEPNLRLEHVLSKMDAKPHAFSAPLALLIFHPVEEEKPVAADYIANAVQALIERGFHVCIGAPNTDPGNFKLVDVLAELSKKEQVTFYGNLARSEFINLFRRVSLIAGNSSAGIVEAASLKLPAVNIGARQRGRLCGKNVVFCGGELSEIRTALDIVHTDLFQQSLLTFTNPYGDGRSAERVVELLKTVDFASMLSKPEDPLHVAH
jgi:UDP-hydrolysing UDP-N-acetyl-D-glucosamine 2-epimerase